MKPFFLFSGQGSQYAGMGSRLIESCPHAKEIFELGSDICGIDLIRLTDPAFAGELNKTRNAQPLIFAMSMAQAEALRERGIFPSGAAGFSLGEVSALCAAGAYTLREGFEIVGTRARFMSEAASERPGAMLAVLGASPELVATACAEASGFAAPVNYNCPGQIVVAGSPEEIDSVFTAVTGVQGVRASRVMAEGAFHTEYMKGASEKFRAELARYGERELSIPVYTNVGGGRLPSPLGLAAHLRAQMTSGVMWSASFDNALRDGYEVFLELGAGKTLSGFARRIDKNAVVIPVDPEGGFQKAILACQ